MEKEYELPASTLPPVMVIVDESFVLLHPGEEGLPARVKLPEGVVSFIHAPLSALSVLFVTENVMVFVDSAGTLSISTVAPQDDIAANTDRGFINNKRIVKPNIIAWAIRGSFIYKISLSFIIIVAFMKHYQKIILCVVALTIAMYFAEWYIRTNHPQLTLEKAQSFSFSCFEEGEHRWIKLASNKTCSLKSQWHAFEPIEVKTNSLGLRNPEVPTQKPDGETRILFVGDSFTMGWGVKENETFARKTEELLRTQGFSNVTSINAGFSAAGPSGYYLYLKYFGLDLDPDIVVVGFFIGNDITARKDVEWVKTDENGMPDIVRSKSTYIDSTGTIRFTDTPLRYRIPILNNSHAFLMLVNAISPQKTSTDPSKEMIRQLTCLFQSNCHDLDTAKREVQFLFKGINSLVSSKGKKLVVLMIPDDYQVNAYPSYKYVQGLPLLPSERRSINNEFIRFFEDEKIAYIDVLPDMMEQAKEPLYLPEDGHWNAAGHAFAANIISDKLREMLTE